MQYVQAFCSSVIRLHRSDWGNIYQGLGRSEVRVRRKIKTGGGGSGVTYVCDGIVVRGERGMGKYVLDLVGQSLR